MDELDKSLWKLLHIAFQIAVIVVIYTVYTYTNIININYVWFMFFISYVDYLIWQKPYNSIFFCLVILGILLLFYKKEEINNKIKTEITNKWSQLTILY